MIVLAGQRAPGMNHRRRSLKRVLPLALSVFGFSLGLASAAHAEVVELLDKTKLNAKIIHYYDGVYTVEVAGQTQKIPKEKIRSIGFQLPPARAEFSTPEKKLYF